MEEVKFQIGENFYQKKFLKSNLRLGKILYIEFIESTLGILIHENQVKNSTKYSINYIAKDFDFVVLTSNFKVINEQIEPLYDQLKEYLDKSTLFSKINAMSNEVRIEHSFKSKEINESKINVIFSVSQRINLVHSLKDDCIAQRLFTDWQPLVVYHLLTCFDSLGAKTPFLNFDDWVRKNKEKLIAKKNESSSELILRCHEEYKFDYGTKNSFYRFIDELLPTQTMLELLQSVKFQKTMHPHLGVESMEDISPDSVKRFLYDYRNNYTHKSRIIHGLSPSINNISPSIWCYVKQELTDKYILFTAIRNWPDIIEKSVKVGLAEYIKTK